MVSIDRATNMVLKYAINDRLEEMDFYVDDVVNREYVSFNDVEHVNSFFINNIDNMYNNYNYEELSDLRYYTGTSFKEVNAILRNNWTYEVNGELTKEKQTNYRVMASNISGIINSKGTELNSNILVYRGVSISAFKNFGVNILADLISLKGQYVYDSGFVSTSLIRSKSFFDRQLDYHEPCNIEIEYLIPNESADGVPLINTELSYNSNEQTEYLINSGNLSKVVDVVYDDVNNKAYVKMVYIPKKVWDLSYRKDNEKNL